MHNFLFLNPDHNSLLVLTVGRVSEKVWTAMSDLTNAAVDVSPMLQFLLLPYILERATYFDFLCCLFISLTSQEWRVR